MGYEYICDFYVNNIRTQERVVAPNSSGAKKLIEARYPGSKVRFVGSPKIV